MKQQTRSSVTALAVLAGLAMASSVHAQTAVLSDFDNFSFTITYANWNADGSQIINGGSGYTPTLTSGPTAFTVNARGFGSGHYSIPLADQQLLDVVPSQVNLSLTLNNINSTDSWLGVKFLLSDNQGNSDVFYGTYTGMFGTDNGAWENGNVGTATWQGNTLTMSVPLTAAMQAGVNTGTSQITGFNLLIDPAVVPGGGVYDITFNSLTISAIPEPTSFALAGIGFVGFVFARRAKA